MNLTATQHSQTTSDLRISEFRPLPAPEQLLAELPLSTELAETVRSGREAVRAVLDGVDDRLLVVVGPCSIHDPDAGLDYARRLAAAAEQHRDDLLIVLRAYFSKPTLPATPAVASSRSTTAWCKPPSSCL